MVFRCKTKKEDIMAAARRRSPFVIETATTISQSETENEVSPFFVDLSSLGRNQLDHLRSVGLLPPLQLRPPPDAGGGGDADPPPDPHAVRLLRGAHASYLSSALSEKLSRGFASLDASRPWMVYWCLHSLDLLGYFDGGGGGDDDPIMEEIEEMQRGALLMRVVSTLIKCWIDVEVEFDECEFEKDPRLMGLGGRRRRPSEGGGGGGGCR